MRAAKSPPADLAEPMSVQCKKACRLPEMFGWWSLVIMATGMWMHSGTFMEFWIAFSSWLELILGAVT